MEHIGNTKPILFELMRDTCRQHRVGPIAFVRKAQWDGARDNRIELRIVIAQTTAKFDPRFGTVSDIILTAFEVDS